MSAPASPGIVGILLAAGRGVRFGGDKLLAPLASAHRSRAGECVGATACRHLLAALPRVVAVVRPDDAALAAALGAAGRARRPLRECRRRHGREPRVRGRRRRRTQPAGWSRSPTCPGSCRRRSRGSRAAVAEGAPVAAPFHAGRRGHPVGFAAACYAALAALAGDEGAKSVVAAHGDSLARIDVDDAGTLRDIDRPPNCPAEAGPATRRHRLRWSRLGRPARQPLPSGSHMSGWSSAARCSSCCAFHHAGKLAVLERARDQEPLRGLAAVASSGSRTGRRSRRPPRSRASRANATAR